MDSSTAASSLLTDKKDFVLKLRLVGVGGPPQIRRVRLHRIASDGSINYGLLVAIAIHATFPEEEGEVLDFDQYDVALTYYDSDNDCITIGSTDELVDAIDQMEGVLRITTDVKRKKTAAATPASLTAATPPGAEKHRSRRVKAPSADVSAGGDAPAATVTHAATAAPPPSDTNTSNPVGGRTVQLQSILESFVGILSVAVAALQTQLQAAGVPRASPAPKVSPAPAATAVATTNRGINEPTPEPSDPAPCVSVTIAPAVVGAAAAASAPPSGDSKPAPEPRPFIHGRHTCDSCFTTPIVGARYHATNLPDYDLCSKCHDNYMGSEIKFEPIELDRDRPFQERWHRKHSKFGGRGRCHGSIHRRRAGRGRGLPVNAPGPKDSNKNMDACLTEAIRRSLRDVSDAIEQASVAASSTAAVAPDKAKTVEEVKEAPPKIEEAKVEASAPVVEDAKMEAAPLKDEPEIIVSSSTMKTEAEIIVTKDEVDHEEEVEQKTEFSTDAEGSGDVAAELGRTLDDVASAISSVVTEIERSVKTVESDEVSEGVVSGVVVEAPVVEEEFVSETEDDVVEEKETEAGATIVDGEEEAEDAESQGTDGTDGSWDVVNEEDQLVQDEMIARAAQVIGSALFESATTVDQASALTESVVSTVPTDVHSVGSSEVPAVSRDRWAVQLTQLRELGFFDEAKNVEILERLYAANIGCDSDDEVTVTQVVNELFKAGN